MSIALPTSPPVLPFIYIDWNVVQYLRKSTNLAPLLEALVRTRCAKAALFPYSIGHLIDATAGWTHIAAEHRAERFRDMLFLDGLSLGKFWEFDDTGDHAPNQLSVEAVIEACDRRGFLTSIREDLEDDPDGLLALVDAECQRKLASAVADMRATAANAVPPLDPHLVEGMVAALEGAYAGGVRELTDSGTAMMSILGPAMLFGASKLGSFSEVPPRDAVARVDAWLRANGTSFERVLQVARDRDPTLPLDAIGPALLAGLGYYPDSAKNIRRAAPGVMPDYVHGRCGLAAAIFMTGEHRLSRRVAAWAAHTGRGEQHDNWPIVLQVTPDDPVQIQHAVNVVTEYNVRFEGVASDLLPAS